VNGIWSKFLVVAAIIGSSAANAEEHLEWHWEGGGGGSCGPFCTSVAAGHIVIDGWRDDGLSPIPDASRFPSFGLGGKSRDSAAGKIPGSGGHPGCKVPKNSDEVRAFAPGNKAWKIYVEAGVPTDFQDALTKNIDAINADQKLRGRDFRVELTSNSLLANTRVVLPSLLSPLSKDGGSDVYYDTSLRGGVLFGSTIVVESKFPEPREALRTAATLLGMAAGLEVDDAPDALYPNAMSPTSTFEVLDPCSLAAIDASLNAGRYK
jgi:hypothetical protein